MPKPKKSSKRTPAGELARKAAKKPVTRKAATTKTVPTGNSRRKTKGAEVIDTVAVEGPSSPSSTSTSKNVWESEADMYDTIVAGDSPLPSSTPISGTTSVSDFSASPLTLSSFGNTPVTADSSIFAPSAFILPATTPSLASSDNRRRSYLSPSIAKSEYTVIDIGSRDGTPRLITSVRSSQGFMWNPELFFGDYLDLGYDIPDIEHMREPTIDIHVSDEEARNMFPQ
ncbi:MAG: hypothetical protein M1824_002383 [Vezdaea acicularis]|nr:MAG: hypothetical protein M1824_002383 [Vezdaea acicularis]